jgi:two-component system NtrC family sensor kinase
MPSRTPCPTPGDPHRQPERPPAIAPSVSSGGLESGTLYRSIAERAEEIVLVLDHVGCFRYVSPSAERVLGYVPSATLGQSVVQFVHPDDVLAVQGTIARALERPGEAQRLSDYRVRHADGTWRDFEAVTTNLLDDATVRGVIVNCHDITERKQVERLLLERSRLARLEAEVGAALAAGGDLDDMLGRCTEILSRALAAPFVRVWVPVPNSPLLEVRGAAGHHSLLVELPNRVSLGTFPIGAIARTRETIAVNDFDDPSFSELRSWIDHERVAAFVGCPLIVEENVVGVLAIFSQQPLGTAAFGALGWVANALAVGIDRALVREALASQREAVLLRLASEIRTSLDVTAVLQTTVREVSALLQIDRCAFLRYRPMPVTAGTPVPKESSYWEVVATVARRADGGAGGRRRQLPDRLGSLTAGMLPILLQHGIITVDGPGGRPPSALVKFMEELGAVAIAVVPVIGRRSQDFSVLCCFQEQESRHWTRREIELLAGVGDQLAVALDQAVLYEEARSAAARARDRSRQLSIALADLKTAQTRLVQAEKLSSLGQMVAGIAHEINNPVAFIHGNLTYASQYLQDLLGLLDAYGDAYPTPVEPVAERLAMVDLGFVREDFTKLLGSMQMGAERIRQIVLSLRNFSHRDRAGMKRTDLHALLEDTLTILQHRLKPRQRHPGIEVHRIYGEAVPPVVCHTGQIGQVLMNLLGNAIDVLEAQLEVGVVEIETEFLPLAPLTVPVAALAEPIEGGMGPTHHWFKPDELTPPTGAIAATVIGDRGETGLNGPEDGYDDDDDDDGREPKPGDRVRVSVRDNGPGLDPEAVNRLFEPFFTTKPVGKGMGLGLSIAYQIVVEGHGGHIEGRSRPGGGAEFILELPVLPATILDASDGTAEDAPTPSLHPSPPAGKRP